jgi:hypothetical protein
LLHEGIIQLCHPDDGHTPVTYSTEGLKEPFAE